MKKLALSVLSVFFIAGVFSPTVLAVDVIDPVCDNVNQVGRPAACSDNQNVQGVGDELIFGSDGIGTKIVNLLSFIVGITAVIAIMIAAVRIITSNGDSNSISESRMWIIGAVIGLVVVSLAQVTVRFVLVNV